MKEQFPYEDLLDLPHHVSKRHPQMSLENRAAQFSPFAALTGHEEAVEEMARLTESRIILDESEKQRLDEILFQIMQKDPEKRMICVTYFVRDLHKEGGAYVQHIGRIWKLDRLRRRIIMEDGTAVEMEDVIGLTEAPE